VNAKRDEEVRELHVTVQRLLGELETLRHESQEELRRVREGAAGIATGQVIGALKAVSSALAGGGADGVVGLAGVEKEEDMIPSSEVPTDRPTIAQMMEATAVPRLMKKSHDRTVNPTPAITRVCVRCGKDDKTSPG
jgi:hypothetical protein